MAQVKLSHEGEFLKVVLFFGLQIHLNRKAHIAGRRDRGQCAEYSNFTEVPVGNDLRVIICVQLGIILDEIRMLDFIKCRNDKRGGGKRELGGLRNESVGLVGLQLRLSKLHGDVGVGWVGKKKGRA